MMYNMSYFFEFEFFGSYNACKYFLVARDTLIYSLSQGSQKFESNLENLNNLELK